MLSRANAVELINVGLQKNGICYCENESTGGTKVEVVYCENESTATLNWFATVT